jgi:hypothetical protein
MMQMCVASQQQQRPRYASSHRAASKQRSYRFFNSAASLAFGQQRFVYPSFGMWVKCIIAQQGTITTAQAASNKSSVAAVLVSGRGLCAAVAF